jgi:tungstate transport system ATP-binding protein
MPLIETVNLCQSRNNVNILKNISLHINRGEFFALIGPTGAGKTTLLRLIDLIDEPTAGKIYFDGMDTTVLAKTKLEIRRRMSFVLQKPVVFNASVYENIALALKWRKMEDRELRGRVNQVMEEVGLTDYQRRQARTLSGGEMQRVAIARAIAVQPEILLLDEPTANLDPLSAVKVEKLITEVVQRYTTTTIMATHDLVQGQRLANRIGVMMNGELLQTGSAGDVFSSPQKKEVAKFVGVENIIEGIISSSEDNMVIVESDEKLIQAISELAVGERVNVCIRPEDVTLALTKSPSSARNSFVGRINKVVSAGPLTRVEIDCGFLLVALVTKKSAEELKLQSGQSVYASFKATGVHIIKRD